MDFITFESKTSAPSKGRLNPALWSDDQLDPVVESELRELANEFMRTADYDFTVTDTVITGSNASYNWTDSSDIDLHVLVEFSDGELGKLERSLAKQVTANWRKSHDVRVHGVPVEMYIQEAPAPVEAGIGQYSLDSGWINRPSAEVAHRRPPARVLDSAYATATEIMRLDLDLRSGRATAREVNARAERLKDSIWGERQKSLMSDGVLGDGNLKFKTLRAWGSLDDLKRLATHSFDMEFS